MSSIENTPSRLFRARWWFACALSAGLFVWSFSQFWIPGKGFTYLLTLGDYWQDRFLPELKAMDVYVEKDSYGYDGLTYAQIAMRPVLTDPELAVAVDNLPFRARRILFCLTASLAGSGDAEQALLAYSLQNAVAWFLLAILLFRWFRQETFGDFFRWFATLFSFGMCFSIRYSLTDGPSLLLISAGIALAEMRKPWLSALVLGISGLGKETNLGAAAAIDLPDRFTVKDWIPVIARGIIIVLPLALWVGYLTSVFGTQHSVGDRNFSLPFVALVGKWVSTIGEISNAHWEVAIPDGAVMISLTAQVLFFACRPRWRDRWWRLGALMSVLMLVIGPAVWEGYPSASARVLLPMLLAFNIAVPRGWKWIPLLIVGNLSIIGSPALMKPPPREDFRITGPTELIKSAETGRYVKVSFDDGWFGMERTRTDYWRWSSGSAGMSFKNPHDFPIVIEVRFDLRSRERRDARLESGSKVLWEGVVTNNQNDLVFQAELPPGETHWRLVTKVPAFPAGGTDPRVLAFNLRNFEMKVLRRADLPPARR